MDKMFKKNCFAYCEKKNKPYCNALREIDCKDCRMYTEKTKIKNNPYYAYSYDDEVQHLRDIRNKHIREDQVVWK